jgi:tetratricopeptide (TPR) repeat protein
MNEESLLFEALKQPDAARRSAFLDQACGRDGELRRRLDGLIAAHERAGGFMAQPAAAHATEAFVPAEVVDAPTIPPSGPAVAAPPPYVGLAAGMIFAERYKLREKLGEGGMGEVWVADQTEPVQRRVALKVIKAGMDTGPILARFDQERQALAMMDHPHIARVYDAGVAKGMPYFVMELIKGQPLTKHCDEHRLSMRQRLELFIPICQAVQHAHQKGIIHRDLKPSNIIVGLYDGKPVPKVIDFGVAKATGPKLTDQSLYTEVGALVGTLEYMSPEQAELNNLDVDTRSDIYALGVILYELLTGSVPLSRKELLLTGIVEMLMAIKEREPPKPSTKVSSLENLPSVAAVRRAEPHELQRFLAGDLDWIVMKCLEKDRNRRYETANQLALELQRYLAHEPVLAGPPSAWYRWRKFYQRHRAGVAMAAVLVLAVVLGLAGTAAGWYRAAQAERIAVAERDAAEAARAQAAAHAAEADRQAKLARQGLAAGRAAIDRAFTAISENKLLNVPGLQPLRKELLEESRQFYQQFIEVWGEEPTLKLDLAAATARVGSIIQLIGSKDEAVAAYRKAAALLRALPDGNQNPWVQETLATIHNNVGRILLQQEKAVEALHEFETAAKLMPEDRPIEAGNTVLDVRANMALTLASLGRLAEAQREIEGAIARSRAHLEREPQRAFLHHVVAGQLNTLGGIRYRQGRYADAEELLQKAADGQRRAIELEPANPDYREWLGNHLFNRAVILETRLKQPERALAVRREAAAVWEKLVRDNPTVMPYRQSHAQACTDLANTLKAVVPNSAEITERYQQAVAELERLILDDPSMPRTHSTLGSALDGWAGLLASRKEWDAAAKHLDSAIAAQRRAAEMAPGEEQFRRFLATHLVNRSRIHLQANQPSAAVVLLQNAETLLTDLLRETAVHGNYEWTLAECQQMLGQAQDAAKKPNEMLATMRRLLETLEGIVRRNPDDTRAIGGLRTAYDHQTQYRPAEAKALRERQVKFWNDAMEGQPGALRPAIEFAHAAIERGELSAEAQEWAPAAEWFAKAVAVLERARRTFPESSELAERRGYVLKWLGDVQWMAERVPEAKAAWVEALAYYQDQARREPRNLQTHFAVGGLLHNLGLAAYQEDRQDDALAKFRLAADHQERVFAEKPNQARRWLTNHWQMQAAILREKEHWAEAAAITLKWAALWPKSPGDLIRAAGDLATGVDAMKSNLDPRMRDRVEEWGRQAINLLTQARAAGAKPQDLAGDPRLAPLKHRADFSTLLEAVPFTKP